VEPLPPLPFPGVVALSHMWLDPAHTDPEERNLRGLWLPAAEWYSTTRSACAGWAR